MDKGTIYDKRLYQLALDTAKEYGIKAQPKLGVFGGNNAGSMHQAAGGIRRWEFPCPAATCIPRLAYCR